MHTPKNIFSSAVLFLFVILIISGCAPFLKPPQGSTVPENKRIPLPDISQSTASIWSGPQMDISYSLASAGEGLDISGSITIHDDILMSFPAMTRLMVQIHFLDATGAPIQVTDITPLYSRHRNIEGPLHFRSKTTLPQNAKFICFSYYGHFLAQPRETAGVWDIYYTPFH